MRMCDFFSNPNASFALFHEFSIISASNCRSLQSAKFYTTEVWVPLQLAWTIFFKLSATKGFSAILKRSHTPLNKNLESVLEGRWCSKTLGTQTKLSGFVFLWSVTACREGMFGQNCQESCRSDSNNNCRGLRFCLPDPYGCSCASGWFGHRCEKGELLFHVN